MLDYLFLVPLSPDSSEGSLRRDLQKLCFEQIMSLYCDYQVWLLGETEFDHPNFKTVCCEGVSKEEKLKEVGDMLSSYSVFAKYLVRLDDDDLINPVVFDSLAKEKFDVAHDQAHMFYDLATDLVSQQKRNWIPNTAPIDYVHALTRVKAKGGARTEDGMNYLFACDHSQAWHPFFEGKKVTHPNETLYVRILNPSSITANAEGEFSEKNYFRYLQGFGSWKAQLPESISHLRMRLQEIRQNHFGEALKFKPKKSFLRRFL
jgi:hypothetical protein